MVVPTTRLYLDVLTYHVEAHLLGDLDIVEQCFVGGGGVDAIGPEALVERTYVEEGLVVEEHAGVVAILGERDLAHTEVTLDGINGLAIGHKLNIEVVEEG